MEAKMVYSPSFLALCFILLGSWKVITTDGNGIGYFWHLTDIHLDRDYNQRAHCQLGPLGDYKCDTTVVVLQSALKLMKGLEGQYKPDFIVFTGDSGPHLSGYPELALKKDIQFIGEEIRSLFSPAGGKGTFVLPTLGNHDVKPTNEMRPNVGDPDRIAWCTELSTNRNLWGTWINWRESTIKEGPPPAANYSNGCYFSKLLKLPNDPGQKSVLLISLNGLLWYTGNPLADTTNPDPLNQLDWLAKSFTWARQHNIRVLIASHFPPGASQNAPRQFRFLYSLVGNRFLQILKDNHDLIMACLFAHIHTDSFRVLYDDKGTPLVPMFIGSSLNPFRLRGLGGFNPRVRLYRYRFSDLQLLGYRQFYLDLAKQKPGGPNPLWQLEYDSNVTYGLPDLSAVSLSKLLDIFDTDSSTDGMWSGYWAHELGLRPHEPKPGLLTPDGLCPQAKSQCRCQHLCAMRYLNLSRLDTCLATCSGISLKLSFMVMAINTFLTRIMVYFV